MVFCGGSVRFLLECIVKDFCLKYELGGKLVSHRVEFLSALRMPFTARVFRDGEFRLEETVLRSFSSNFQRHGRLTLEQELLMLMYANMNVFGLAQGVLLPELGLSLRPLDSELDAAGAPLSYGSYFLPVSRRAAGRYQGKYGDYVASKRRLPWGESRAALGAGGVVSFVFESVWVGSEVRSPSRFLTHVTVEESFGGFVKRHLIDCALTSLFLG